MRGAAFSVRWLDAAGSEFEGRDDGAILRTRSGQSSAYTYVTVTAAVEREKSGCMETYMSLRELHSLLVPDTANKSFGCRPSLTKTRRTLLSGR